MLCRLHGWNTLGAVLGDAVPDLVLIDRLGVERSLYALAASYDAASLLLALGGPRTVTRAGRVAAGRA